MKSSLTTTSSSESGIAMTGYHVFAVLLAVKVSLTEEFRIEVTAEVDRIMCRLFLVMAMHYRIAFFITDIFLSFISFVPSIWDGKRRRIPGGRFDIMGLAFCSRCGRIWKYIIGNLAAF
jgi:hypothetical protein